MTPTGWQPGIGDSSSLSVFRSSPTPYCELHDSSTDFLDRNQEARGGSGHERRDRRGRLIDLMIRVRE